MVVESVRLALGRLRVNAARSALTVLGVVIGVGAIVALVAVGNGSAEAVNAQFAGLGANTLTVVGGRGFSRGLRGGLGSGTPLTLADASAVSKAPGVGAVAPVIQRSLNVSYGGTSETTSVQATTPSAASIDNLQVQAGRFFSHFANDKGLPVAVLGAQLASDLDVDPTTAAGTTISLGGVPYTIVGVLQPQGGVGFLNPDDNVLVPINSVIGRLVGSDPSLSQMRVAAAPGDTGTFGASVENAMRQSHDLAAGANDDFLVVNPTTIVQARKSSSATFTRLITAIAAISLVVGGIGIANVMLVAVRERTREIGIRRAVGARRRDVLVQFLTEATVLSVLGGLLGVVAGLIVAYAIPHFSHQRTQVSYLAAVIALGASAIVGIAAGVGPAQTAAALEPAQALRYE